MLYAFHREPVWRSTKADASASVASKVSVFPPERATNAVVVSEVGWCTTRTGLPPNRPLTAHLTQGLEWKRLARPLEVEAEDHGLRLQAIIVIRDVVRRRALA